MSKPANANKSGQVPARINQELVNRILAAKSTEAVPSSRASLKLQEPHADLTSDRSFDFKKFKNQLRDIKDSISVVRNNHRKALDQDLVRCFDVADQLRRAVHRQRGMLGSEMKKICQKIGENEQYALEYVLHETFSDNKQASFYFRALKQPFQNRVSRERLLDVVYEKGGYQKLANEQAKKRHRDPELPASAPSDGSVDSQSLTKTLTSQGGSTQVQRAQNQLRPTQDMAASLQKPSKVKNYQCVCRFEEAAERVMDIEGECVVWFYAEVRPVPKGQPDIIVSDFVVVETLE